MNSITAFKSLKRAALGALVALSLVGTAAPAFATISTLPARSGFPQPGPGSQNFRDELACWGSVTGDPINSVRYAYGANNCGSVWELPIPTDYYSSGTSYAQNVAVTLTLGTSVSAGLTLMTFYNDGTYYTANPSEVPANIPGTTKYLFPATTVPSGGFAIIGVAIYSYYERIDSYQYGF